MGAFVGIGIYKNDERFYDKCLMPIVRKISPELCHRLAVIGFKYNLFPQQKEIDAERLVSKFKNIVFGFLKSKLQNKIYETNWN